MFARFEPLETRQVFAAIDFTGTQYNQNFDTLPSSGTNQAWTNDSTIQGWSLFNKTPAAITSINADNGGSGTGSFYSHGTTGQTERALGGVASGGAYFGSPATGTVAGWMTVAFNNATASTITDVNVGFTGEQWRNGGNETAQTMKMEYGFGATFAGVTAWNQAPSSLEFTSPITGTTAGALDGNIAANRAALSGTLSAVDWQPGSVMWLRWIENNDSGNDHGLAIDDFTLSLPTNPGTSTTTALTSVAPLTADAGATITFTGTVTATTGTAKPVGAIEIRNNGTVLATTNSIDGTGASGTFSISSSTIPVGVYSNLQAVFVAGNGFSGSSSSTFASTLTINAVGAPTTTTLGSVSPLNANTGDAVTFSGTVVAGSGTATPTGTIEIRNGGATGTLLASTTTIGGSGVNGTYSITTTTLPAGSYSSIQAFFVPANTSFQSSSSANFGSTLTITTVNATALSAGDIAVIGYNTSGSPDSLTIVTLRALDSGTTFYVNDNEIATDGGTAFTDLGEREAAFTVKPGQTIPAGTVITLPWGAAAVDTTTYSWSDTSNSGLGNNNEEIYIYTANSIADLTPTAFIFGTKIGSSPSLRPNGLTTGTTFIAPSGTAARYKTTGATYSGSKEALLTAIGDTVNNWEAIAPVNPTDWSFNVTSATNTTTTLASVSPLTVDQGQSVTFSGTITAASGSVTPVGTVEIRNGSTVLASTTTIGGTGANGTFSISTTSIPEGTYSNLRAFFVASTGFNSSASGIFGSTLTVNRVGAITTTALNSISPATAVVGSQITFTGTVTAGSGTTTPSGVIEIRDGGATGVLLARTTAIGGSGASGTFSITSTTVPTGTFSNIQAFFIPATGFLASNSAASSTTLTVTPVGQTTLAAGDLAVIGYNTSGSPDSMTLLVLKTLGEGTTFFISDNEVAAAGNASFLDLGELEASFTVKAGQSIAAGTVITLPWGAAADSSAPYTWDATGGGLGNNDEEIYIYTANAITDLTPTAFIFGTKIGQSTTAVPAGLTEGTTFIAPTGTASRYKTSGATYSGDQATLLAAIGDTTNNWEAVAPVNTYDWSFLVAPTVATSMTLDSVSPLNANQGTAVTFTGTIVAATGAALPSGTIQIRNGGASGALLASTTTIGGTGVNGTFSISTTTLPAGTYSSLQAFFVPNSGFGASSSAVFGSTLTIKAVGANTVTTLTNVSPLNAVAGDAITFTGSVVAQSGTATPAGTIEIRNGTTVLATTTTIGGTGVNGSFSITSTTIPVGSYDALQAFFLPDTGFIGSNSSIFSSTLNVAAPANLVNLTTIGSPSSQDFDTLASTGTTSSSMPLGWLFSESGTNANTTYTVGTGSSGTGDTYSFGAAGSTDRALGGVQSGSLIPTIGAAIKNSTGGPIGQLNIAYTGEQWRLGATGRADRLDFQYSLDATSLTTGTWVDVDSLDFSSPVTTGTTGALNGNDQANRTALAASITGLNIPSGATFYIRWNDFNADSTDDGLAIDDFSITPVAGNPSGLIGLSSASFNVAENAGTAVVSVQRVGGTTGAVSVSYATVAGGTAIAGTDYSNVSGTLTWNDGETGTKTFTIPITDNSTLGLNKTINIAISNPTGGAELSTIASGTVTIRENERAAQLLLNEIEVNPPSGSDRPFEYVELRGTSAASLANWYVVQIDGTSATAGRAAFVSELSNASVGSNGLLIVKASSGGHTIPAATTVVSNAALDGTTGGGLLNSSQTMALIFSTTPLVAGQDLDTDNDGTLDLPAGAEIVDMVGWLNPANLNDMVYGGALLTQATGTPDAATRFFGNDTANSGAAWFNGDLFDNGTTTLNSELLYDATKASTNLPPNAALTPGDANVLLTTGLSIAASQTALPEGNSGSTPFTFIVTRAGGTSGETSVNWSVTGSGANPADAADFVGNALPSGVLTFAVGETSKSITINVQGDTTVETHERFTVTLSNPTGGAAVTVASADSTITSDDLQILSVGDLVITGFNGDNPDEFSFVPLVALAPFTEIRFTDNGWLSAGGFRDGEGVLLYVAPASGIAAGTEVGIANSTGTSYVTTPQNTLGSVSLESGSFGLSTDGDSLTAFQGLITSPTSIFSVTKNRATFDDNASDANTSALPTGLELGTSAVAVGGASASVRNSEYTGTTSGTVAGLRSSVSNASNWTSSATRITLTYSNFTITTNGAPSITAGGSATFNGAPVVIDNSITVTDSDSTNLTGATVSLTAGFASGQDVLRFVNVNGITGSYNSTSGVLTLTGTASVANYQAALRSVTYNNTSATPSTAQRTVVFQVTDGTSSSNSASSTVAVNNVAGLPLFVPAIAITTTGVTVHFNRPIDVSKINLYDQGGSLGAADVTLVGSSTGVVTGSLIFNSDNRGFTFVKTGSLAGSVSGLLAPDTYTLTLRSSASNGFADLAGNALRDIGGSSAGNYVTTFTVAASPANAIMVSLPDFARGFAQAVNVPATASGLPVLMSNANNVSRVDFTVNYDPALLTITGFTATNSSATTTVDTSVPGTVRVVVTGATALSGAAGLYTLGRFTATVPNNAPYTLKQLLQFSALTLSDSSGNLANIPAIADNAVHIASFFGDTSGNNAYGGNDALLIQRIVVGSNTGFSAYQMADPALVGDISLNSSLGGNDALFVQRAVVGTAVPNIPALPAGVTAPPPSGPDPKLYIPKTLTNTADVDSATPGIQIDIPVMLEVTEAAGITMAGVDFFIDFDPAVLSIADSSGSFTAGNLLTSNNLVWTGEASVVNGRVSVTRGNQVGSSVLPFGTVGTLYNIRATVLSSNPGTSVLNLRAASAVYDNSLSELTLVPAPTDGSTDEVDGLLTITNSNIAPAINPQSFSVFNKAASGTVIGTVLASDVNAGQTLTYSITGGNTGGLFAINATTGVITKATAATLSVQSYALTVQVSDGLASSTAVVTINARAANTAPRFFVNGAPATTTGVQLTEVATGSTTTVGTLVATVTATDVDQPATMFSLTMTDASGAFAFNPANGQVTVKDTAALSRLNFETAKPFKVVFAVTDSGLAGLGKPITARFTLLVSLIDANDAPTISYKPSKADPQIGANVDIRVLDTRTVAPFASVTIGDADKQKTSPDTLSVVITVDEAKGVFTAASLTKAGVTKDADVPGRYTFSGNAKAATGAISKLLFKPTENRVRVGNSESIQFTLTVSDNIAAAVVDSSTTVISTSVNNAPRVSGTAANQLLASDKLAVLPFSAVNIEDVDVIETTGTSSGTGQPLTVTVALDKAEKGAFTVASLNQSGFVADTSPGTYRFTGTAAQATAAIRKLSFQAAENRVVPGKAEVTKFTISVSDAIATKTTVNKSTSVITTSTNDDATIGGTAGSVVPSIDDKSTTKPFTGFSVADVDVKAKVTVTVTLSDAGANGILLGKFKRTAAGVYSFTGTPARATAELQNLVFRPTANQVAPGSSRSTTFAIAVKDEQSASPTTNAGPVLMVTSTNDAPTITGAKGGLKVKNGATVVPFGKVSILDPDNQDVTVTITLSDATNGIFTSGSLGGFVAGTTAGSYTFTGRAAAATTAIRGLSFQASKVGSTTLTIKVNDGIAADATNSDTTIVAS